MYHPVELKGEDIGWPCHMRRQCLLLLLLECIIPVSCSSSVVVGWHELNLHAMQWYPITWPTLRRSNCSRLLDMTCWEGWKQELSPSPCPLPADGKYHRFRRRCRGRKFHCRRTVKRALRLAPVASYPAFCEAKNWMLCWMAVVGNRCTNACGWVESCLKAPTSLYREGILSLSLKVGPKWNVITLNLKRWDCWGILFNDDNPKCLYPQ